MNQVLSRRSHMLTRKTGYVVSAMVFIALMVAPVDAKQGSVKQDSSKDSGEACYNCHSQIKSLKENSKHAKLSCEVCHSGLKEHLQSFQNKPVTAIDQAVCGKCHGNQAESSMMIN